MTFFEYSDAPFPVRDDIKTAHREYWNRLASPGSWWNGEERIAIAAESRAARSCKFCKARKKALSPYTMEGEHDSVSGLNELAIDAVHRIVTDQNRITQAYVDQNVEAGLSKEQYVELAGVVVMMVSIDEFHKGIGVPLEPLPEPVAGEPDGYLPPNLTEDTGFVPMLTRDGAVGKEADLWAERTANVMRALTLVPDALRDWKMLASAQYLSLEGMANMVGQEDRSINRMQMELVAGRVSSVNECFY